MMTELLQELASQNHDILMDDMKWDITLIEQTQSSEYRTNFPSVWELTRHISNWMKVFTPPVQVLDIQGGNAIIDCLESRDFIISTLAAIMLGYDEFSYLGSYELFNELFNARRQTILRLELGRLICTIILSKQEVLTNFACGLSGGYIHLRIRLFNQNSIKN